MYIQHEPDSLTHYGVKGMKWGVRKDRDKGGNLSSKLQQRRNAHALVYKTGATAYNKSIDRKLAKKVAKLERKASDARVRAEIVKERNADLVERNAEWKRKPIQEKLKDKQTYNMGTNYNKATKQAVQNAKAKYGDQQVKRIQNEDTAKTVAMIAGLAATELTLGYLYHKYA